MAISTQGDVVKYSIGGVDAETAVGVVLMSGTAAAGSSTNPLFTTESRSATATVTAVASGIASVTIKAANTARKGITVTNTDANILYLLVGGGTASATNFSVAVAATTGYWEAPYGFTGAITGIWALDGAGSALVTEYT